MDSNCYLPQSHVLTNKDIMKLVTLQDEAIDPKRDLETTSEAVWSPLYPNLSPRLFVFSEVPGAAVCLYIFLGIHLT